MRLLPTSLLLPFLLASPAVHAQPVRQASESPGNPAPAADASAGAPAPLVILFDEGSSALRHSDSAVLDRASRAYNEGKPIVMIVTGMSDRTGSARVNLGLSQRRANAVLRGLLDRGIPAEKFQVLAKGESEPAVTNKAGGADPSNRRVEITWH